MSNQDNVFKTDNLSLCPFLELKGLRPKGVELGLGKSNTYKVFFLFVDPENIGKDLEIDFRFSMEKKYRDLSFYYRNEISKVQDLLNEKNRQVGKREI